MSQNDEVIKWRRTFLMVNVFGTNGDKHNGKWEDLTGVEL